MDESSVGRSGSRSVRGLRARSEGEQLRGNSASAFNGSIEPRNMRIPIVDILREGSCDFVYGRVGRIWRIVRTGFGMRRNIRRSDGDVLCEGIARIVRNSSNGIRVGGDGGVLGDIDSHAAYGDCDGSGDIGESRFIGAGNVGMRDKLLAK